MQGSKAPWVGLYRIRSSDTQTASNLDRAQPIGFQRRDARCEALQRNRYQRDCRSDPQMGWKNPVLVDENGVLVAGKVLKTELRRLLGGSGQKSVKR